MNPVNTKRRSNFESLDIDLAQINGLQRRFNKALTREENVNETRKQALEFFLEFSRLREHPDRKISPQGRKWRGAFRLIHIYETAYPTLFRNIQWDSEIPVEVLTAKFCNKLLESGKITWMIIFSIVLFCAQFDELSRKECAKLFAYHGLNSKCLSWIDANGGFENAENFYNLDESK